MALFQLLLVLGKRDDEKLRMNSWRRGGAVGWSRLRQRRAQVAVENTIEFDRVEPSVYARIARTGLRTDMTTRAAYTSDASIFRHVHPRPG